MTSLPFYSQPDAFDNMFDLNQIFIGREQQFDLFEMYLNRWKELIFNAEPDDTFVTSAPSPDDKIEGLIILLYGRGGFGKSTLLRRYWDFVSKQDYNRFSTPGKTIASKIIDWDSAIEGKRSLFHNTEDQDISANEYFRILSNKIAIALDKRISDFKNYQKAIIAVESAQKEAKKVINDTMKDDPRTALNLMAGEGIVKLIRWAAPRIGQILQLDNEKVSEQVKKVIGKGVDVGVERLADLYTKLHDKLGSRLADYTDPALRLGLALGSDLNKIACDFPLLIFFDTYEEIDEGDHLLRIVMKAAGLRVGWILAGRDNLWAGAGQRERSTEIQYGYKEIVPPDRVLTIDFNTGGVGGFTLSDIKEYFNQLCERVSYEPALPKISNKDAKRLMDVTRGVPLAVKIAAGLYLETTNLDAITEKLENKREIIDQMVRRYLRHTNTDQDDRAKLYSLAMLRRANQTAIVAALKLTPEDAESRYATELSRLHRRYSFIFTEADEPSLHAEVRFFLRQWLLSHRSDPGIQATSKKLVASFQSLLQELEKNNHYSSLKERLLDDEWVEAYLDLMEQQFWLDPASGVRCYLPFVIAAAAYRSDINENVDKVATFFENQIKRPYNRWYESAYGSLISTRSPGHLGKRFIELRELESLTYQHPELFSLPSLSLDCQQELRAILWWKLGQTYRDTDKKKSLEWYDKALNILIEEKNLKREIASLCWELAEKLYQEENYQGGVMLLDRCFTLDPGTIWLTIKGVSIALSFSFDSENDASIGLNQGRAYAQFKDYERAIKSYTASIERDPSQSDAYCYRGLAYRNFNKLNQAIDDLSQAIKLLSDEHFEAKKYTYLYFSVSEQDTENNVDIDKPEPESREDLLLKTYSTRGEISYELKKYEQASEDFSHAIQLDPDNAAACSNRGAAYGHLKKYEQALEDCSHAIQLDPDNATAYAVRGTAYIGLKKYEQALEDLSHAVQSDPDNALFYVNRGTAYGYLKKHEQALEDLSHAIQLDPDNATAYSNRGFVYLHLKDTSQAKADYNDAYTADPKNINSAWAMVWIEMGRQRPGRETAKYLEEIASIDPEHYVAYICRAIALGIQGKIKEGLAEVEKAFSYEAEQPDAYFWKGMLSVYYYRERSLAENALTTIKKSLTFGLPPILLIPLYWLETDLPDFFEKYARSLLEEYGL